MGAIKFFSSNTDVETKTITEYININPVPAHFKIIRSMQIGRYVVATINYPECINYEGNKILVFDDDDIENIKLRKEIDPHFFKHSNIIARFKPDNVGWKNAVLLCAELLKRDNGLLQI